MRLRLVASFGPSGSPLATWIGGSLAVHALLFLGIVWISALKEKPRFDDPYIVTSLLPPSADPGGATAPVETPAEPEPEPPPPEPEPEPEPEGDTAVPENVRPDPDPPKPEPEPEKEPPKPKLDRKKPPPREEETPAEPGDGAGAPGPSAGDAGGAVGGVVGLGTQYDYYNQQLVNALLRSWKKPVLAGLRRPLVTVAAYEIANDGSVRNLRIVESSGVPTMDRSVLRAIGEASLPPLPPQLRGAPRSVQSAFELTPESGF